MKTKYAYYFYLLIGLLLGPLLWIGCALFQIGAPTASSSWIGEMYQYKIKIARSKPEHKLVLVSGSNGSYGVRTDLIERELHVPAVNLAVSAGLGLDYILARARSVTKPGDTVLLALEYELYAADGEPNEVLIDHVLAYDPEFFYALDWFEQARIIFSMRRGRLIDGLLSRLGILPPPPFGASLIAERFNTNGDIVANLASASTIDRKLAERREGPSNLKGVLSAHAAEVLTNFSQWCKANRVTLLATYPATIHFPEYDLPPKKQVFERVAQFYPQIKVPTLGSPLTFMYARSAFFDTTYHLHSTAAVHRTQQLIALMRHRLAPTPVRVTS